LARARRHCVKPADDMALRHEPSVPPHPAIDCRTDWDASYGLMPT
jgi:hypothetical protein